MGIFDQQREVGTLIPGDTFKQVVEASGRAWGPIMMVIEVDEDSADTDELVYVVGNSGEVKTMKPDKYVMLVNAAFVELENE